MYKIILASASPRRKQILENLEIPFEVIPSYVDENLDLNCSPYDCVKTLSSKKAYAVLGQVKGPALILGVDTIVSDLGKILNKPKSREDAIGMIKHLQGRHHSVYTGVTLLFVEEDGSIKEDFFVDGADVTFNNMDDEEIELYLDMGDYTDKAGAYGIQGKAAIFVSRINGNYSTVVGLPVHLLYKELKKHGIQLMEMLDKKS